jgi:hypothetical protein
MMQKVNIDHGQTKMDKMVRRRELPCVRRSRLSNRVRVVRGTMSMSMERKKKVMKKQRRGKEIVDGKSTLVAIPSGV